MSSSIVFIPVLILLLLLFTAVPVILGLFVYRDAKARGMDALLWTLLAVFAPGFIGLIVYLVVRRDHVKLSCPTCGGEVQQGFVTCPGCGQKLSASCVKCGSALRPEWKLCPQCGTAITETGGFAPPVVNNPKSTGFVIALAAILAVPLILVIIGFSAFAFTGSAGMADTGDNSSFAGFFFADADVEPVAVSSSDWSEITDAQRQWIAEKQSGKKGIFSTRFSKTLSDSTLSDDQSDRYEISYDYTVIVIRAEGGKLYVPDGFQYDSSEFLPEKITLTLAERDASDEEAARYGNVFIVRTLSKYRIDFASDDGSQETVAENELDAKSKIIGIRLTDGSGKTAAEYRIPIGDSKEHFTPFVK